MAEPGAVPAGGIRNPALGRRRNPTPGHYEPGARSLQPAGAPHVGFTRFAQCKPPVSAGRRPESTAVERREACALRQRARRVQAWL